MLLLSSHVYVGEEELGMIYVGKDEALGSLPCRRDA